MEMFMIVMLSSNGKIYVLVIGFDCLLMALLNAGSRSEAWQPNLQPTRSRTDCRAKSYRPTMAERYFYAAPGTVEVDGLKAKNSISYSRSKQCSFN